MILENQLFLLQKCPFDYYGYYDQNGNRLFFESYEDAVIFEKNLLISFFRFFK